MIPRNKYFTSIAVFTLIGTCLLGGCTVISSELGTGLPADPPLFNAGQASVGDVLESLGPPLRMSALPKGYAFLYSQLQMYERQLGFSLPKFNLLKLSFGRSNFTGWTTLLIFNEDGTLSEQVVGKTDKDLGRGVAVQIIVAIEETVDTSFLTGPQSAHHWGMNMLQPLPVALNTPHGMDSGASGLEQRGTPINVGQRTLENH